MKWLTAVGGGLMVLGFRLNAFVVGANGGAMPIAVSSDLPYTVAGRGAYVQMTADTPYRALGDIIRIGTHDYFSVGDFAMYVGAAVLITGLVFVVLGIHNKAMQSEARV
jgi:hypothetical protein